MGFRKQIESKKAVAVNYWRLKSLSFGDTGILRMQVAGYKDASLYLAGADPIDEYECVISNADVSLKAPFYELLEQRFPLFRGAEKELAYNGQPAGPQVLTVQTPRGELIMREVIGAEDVASIGDLGMDQGADPDEEMVMDVQEESFPEDMAGSSAPSEDTDLFIQGETAQ
jgi:hypothetical protein